MEILVHRRLEKYDVNGCEVVDHKINACLRPATDKIFDGIGVNSSSRFRFRARTNRQLKIRDTTASPSHTSDVAIMGKKTN